MTPADFGWLCWLSSACFAFALAAVLLERVIDWFQGDSKTRKDPKK